MPTITCQSIHGNFVDIPAEKLFFRPSAYAVLVQDRRILLITNRSNGSFAFPGGGVEINERNEQALHREMQEETGLKVEIERFLFFKEHFFYYDPLDLAFHSYMFFYLCRPLTFDLLPDDQVDDLEASTPRWVALADLRREQMQDGLRDVYDRLMEMLK
jgi:8-oxo-dGTP diphosphatase